LVTPTWKIVDRALLVGWGPEMVVSLPHLKKKERLEGWANKLEISPKKARRIA
jgi:hypothetical protein